MKKFSKRLSKRLIAAIVISAIAMVAFVMMLVYPGAEVVTTPSPLPSTEALGTVSPPLEPTSPAIQPLQAPQDDYDEEPIITEYFTLRLSNIAGQGDRFGIVTISNLNAITYTFPADTRTAVRATAASGYEFAGWHDNASGTGRAISTSHIFSLNITEDTNLYARFRTAPTITGTGKDTDLYAPLRTAHNDTGPGENGGGAWIPTPTPTPLPPGVENFHYIYHSHVEVVHQPPLYSVKEANSYIITVYTPDDKIRALTMGDTFVLKPTADKPDGMAGVITNIANGTDGEIIITADLPEYLEDIFDEFEFEADLDALAMEDTEYFLDAEMDDVDGVSIVSNTNNLVRIVFADANIEGVTLNGNIEIRRPSVNVSLSLRDLGRLTLSTEARVNVDATVPDGAGPVDVTHRLFNIRMRVLGTGIDIPVGIRITSTGTGVVKFTLGVDTEFGMGGVPRSPIPNIPRVTPTFALREHREATEMRVTLNIQARARVLWIPVYGVQGDLGKGVRNVTNVVCSCVLSDVFPVMNVSSLTDWGIFRNVLQFDVNVAELPLLRDIVPIHRWHSDDGGRYNTWQLGMPTSTCGP